MDELKKHLEVLGLKPGASVDEVKAAYRELAMVWHPDRFPADSPLQARATLKLKDVNLAYDYVMAHGFNDGIPIIPEEKLPETGLSPAPGEVEPAQTPEAPPAGVSKLVWILGVVLLFAAVGGGWLYYRTHNSKPAPVAINAPTNVVEITKPAANPEPAPAPVNPQAPPSTAGFTGNFLPLMRPEGERAVTNTGEGMVLSGESWLYTREEYSPPLVIHALAKTDLTNIRLAYAQGRVIFNWELNPSELRFHDPVTGQISAVANQGKVPVNEWQDIEWFIETNSSRVLVNGIERARLTGNYSGLAELAAIGTARGGTVTVKQFEVRELAPDTPRVTPGPGAGLVLYFPFETDEYGVVTDQSGFKNNGTVHGAKFIREGKVGGAMLFHGGSAGGDTISVPHSPSLVAMQRTRQITVCAWIKPNSLPTEFPVILSKGGNFAPKSYGGYELDLHPRKDDDILFVSGKFGVVTEHARGEWLPEHSNNWIHIAAVVNTATGTTKIYVNGERTGDETTFGQDWRRANFVLPNNLYVGGPDPSHHPNRAWFDGMIDEVRVYTRTLTPEEIRKLPGF